jgi:flagellar hook protein FlgE
MGWNSGEETCARRSFVDSLGQERTVEMTMNMDTMWWEVDLLFTSGQFVRFAHEFLNGCDIAEDGCTLDEAAKQIVITFEDTGAELRFDLSDLAMIDADPLQIVSGGTLPWRAAPMICEEGTYKMRQELMFEIDQRTLNVCLTVERNEDAPFTGRLFNGSFGFDGELDFDAEGRVSGYKFTKNGNSTDDPSVGVKQTGALVKGVHFVSSNGGTDLGTIDIDLRFAQIINRTGADLMVNGSAIKPKALESGAIPEEIKAGFAPLSPSSLSIDEHGVLSRLKDNGDWEPVYLLACGQFAAMDSAEEKNGVYYATPASGALQTGVSGKDGMGTITSGTLERSTTDLAHELSEMIRVQHAYAANTKVLSTIEDMLTELERL